MNNFQESPVKLYIQDIFRAKVTENKYIYELFGMTFKNVMIHGVITAVYNTNNNTTNVELSDATGSVQIYYDSTKSNINTSPAILKDLYYGFSEATRAGNDNVNIMSALLDRIGKKAINFAEGDYLSVTGDIFLDDRKTRMVSAYECVSTSVGRDIIWMEELRYIYEKFYLWNK
ncbi:uncharacterized protein LOC113505121 [Trichoplusia ni]|uniref:Uncharacterized protein LOC113505121 n=1 Tax=Trichoplusia ni TaxID=7111 RepID=A0A7E5WS65_TRINI|nr:uncharacterized protein LOC113505121 [Trichoplusia ni]